MLGATQKAETPSAKPSLPQRRAWQNRTGVRSGGRGSARKSGGCCSMSTSSCLMLSCCCARHWRSGGVEDGRAPAAPSGGRQTLLPLRRRIITSGTRRACLQRCRGASGRGCNQGQQQRRGGPLETARPAGAVTSLRWRSTRGPARLSDERCGRFMPALGVQAQASPQDAAPSACRAQARSPSSSPSCVLLLSRSPDAALRRARVASFSTASILSSPLHPARVAFSLHCHLHHEPHSRRSTLHLRRAPRHAHPRTMQLLALLALGAAAAVGTRAQSDFAAINNVTSLAGTWSSGSFPVSTGLVSARRARAKGGAREGGRGRAGHGQPGAAQQDRRHAPRDAAKRSTRRTDGHAHLMKHFCAAA
jgi:hypothetical protein